jgi:hypothetical protein
MEARYTTVATVLLKIGKRELQKWVFNRKEAFFTPSHRSSSQCVACVLQLLLPETVIAAVLLFHERSVGEIVANLRPGELEQVIKLVGRRSKLLSAWSARRPQRPETTPPPEHVGQCGIRSARCTDQARP